MAAKRRNTSREDPARSRKRKAVKQHVRSTPSSSVPLPPVEQMISEVRVRSAVDALWKDYQVFARKRARRLEAQGGVAGTDTDEPFVLLGVTLVHPPFKERLRPDVIRLKHSLVVEDEDEVLLIAKDPHSAMKDHLAAHGSGGVTKVLGVDEIRKRYGTHEGRRELLGLYDHFLIDQRVAPMATNLLGKAFIEAKRLPLAVDTRRDITAAIRRTLCSTALCLRRGTSTSLRVARMDFERDMVVENVLMAVQGVVKKIGSGWKGVQSLVLKTSKSPALPIYLALPGRAPKTGAPRASQVVANGEGKEMETEKETEVDAVETKDKVEGHGDDVDDDGVDDKNKENEKVPEKKTRKQAVTPSKRGKSTTEVGTAAEKEVVRTRAAKRVTVEVGNESDTTATEAEESCGEGSGMPLRRSARLRKTAART